MRRMNEERRGAEEEDTEGRGRSGRRDRRLLLAGRVRRRIRRFLGTVSSILEVMAVLASISAFGARCKWGGTSRAFPSSGR